MSCSGILSIVVALMPGHRPGLAQTVMAIKIYSERIMPPFYRSRTAAFSRHPGWIRHGIAEIIKMGRVKDLALIELLEAAGPDLVRTAFGTVATEPGSEIDGLSKQILGLALKSYVESEYDNLYETHQCRPHAFGHTWSHRVLKSHLGCCTDTRSRWAWVLMAI